MAVDTTYKPIPLPDIDGFTFFPPLAIVYIQAIRNGSNIYFLGMKEPHKVPYSLDDMLELVPDEKFCRVNKSFIICVQHLRKTNQQKTRIIYSQELVIPVTDTYRDEFI
ncbi:MAG: LytTR family transcriptional regulator, partial [Chitinophagaceae bacterium]|nr:LytTR family transcriptional regulator [Chitinophagaceae bacterium]